MTTGTRNVIGISAALFLAVVSIGGANGQAAKGEAITASAAQSTPPDGAAKTRITKWTDPRPTAWKSEYPLFAGVAAGDGSLARIQREGTLKICVDQSYYPINTINPKTKKPEGWLVDMDEYIRDKLGIAKVEYVNIGYSALIAGLKTKKCDVMDSGLAIRTDRANAGNVRFTWPTYIFYDVLMTQKAHPLKDLGELKGKSVCSTTGSTDALNLGSWLAKDGLSDSVKVREFNSLTECLLALQNGQVDAAWGEEATASAGLAKYDGLIRAAGPYPYIPSGKYAKDGTDNPYTFGASAALTRDEDRDLNLAWSVAVSMMMQDGTHQRILEKWKVEVPNSPIVRAK